MTISIITSCYNGSRTLNRVFESLVNQTDYDFEWILVDDFSTDNNKTKELILEIKDNAPFTVKHIFLEKNYFGSKSAYEACKIAEGKYVCNLDQDDFLLDNSISIVKKYLFKYEFNQNFVGIAGRCIDLKGNLIGDKYYADEQLEYEMNIRFQQKMKAELIQFTKKEVFFEYCQLLKPGYTYGYVMSSISQKYRYLFVNDVFRVYDTVNPESYTNSKKINNKYEKEKIEMLSKVLDIQSPFFRYDIISSIKRTCYLIIRSKELSIELNANKFENNRMKLYYYFSIPLTKIYKLYKLFGK